MTAGHDDRAWAAATRERVIAEAREQAVAEVRERLRERMIIALLRAVDEPAGPAGAATSERAASEPPRAESGTGLWLYGVTEAGVDLPPDLVGVDGRHRVRGVRSGPLCALASEVPLPEFGPDTLQQRLEHLDRLEALARAHEDVLERALDAGSVVPFRLCTIYASEQSLAAMLDDERDRLLDTLQRLRGVREWGVKGFVTGTETSDATVGPAASGSDYLSRKRELREAAERTHERTLQLVERIHAGLSEQATAAVLARPQDRRLSGREAPMVLNAAYLVPDDRFDEFRALIAELAERHRDAGIELELTGPWPAYHFVEAGGA